MTSYLVHFIDDKGVIVEVSPAYSSVAQAQQAQAAITAQLNQSDWYWNINGSKFRIAELRVVADTKFKTPWYAHPIFVFGSIGAAVAGYVWYRRSKPLSGIGIGIDNELIGGGGVLRPSILAKRLIKSGKLAPAPEIPKSVGSTKPKKGVILPKPDPTEAPADEKRLSQAQQDKLKLLSTLIDRFHEGKASPGDADTLCDDEEIGPSLCESWCYRIGYSTGFCAVGKCHCSGLREQ